MSDVKNSDIIIVRCKKCGHVLYHKHKKFIDLTGLPEVLKEQLKDIPVEVLLEAVRQPIEIKCNSRTDKGFCKEINTLTI